LDQQISGQIDEFIQWWDAELLKLLEGRVPPGRSSQELCDMIGVIVEGILLSSDRPLVSALKEEDLLKAIVSPLLEK
jgi:hypothetical protein